MDVPVSTACGHTLDRIDRVAIEHLIIDPDMYPSHYYEVHAGQGLNGEMGVGSEVRLVCGYCMVEVPREQREFFYSHWWAVQAAVESLGQAET